MAFTVVLNLAARPQRVSPAAMVYENEPAGQVGGGGVTPPGMQIIWPTTKLLGFIPGLIAIMAATVVLYLCANTQRVSPDLMVYENEPAGQVVGGGVTPPGMHMTWPICRLLGFMPGFIAVMAATVVLYLCANTQRVSPDLMVYENEPAGQVVGGGVTPPGMQITWPICRLLGLTPGLARCIASTVVLYLFANIQNVSPDLIVYAKVPEGQAIYEHHLH